jgi:hypothetical protein
VMIVWVAFGQYPLLALLDRPQHPSRCRLSGVTET